MIKQPFKLCPIVMAMYSATASAAAQNEKSYDSLDSDQISAVENTPTPDRAQAFYDQFYQDGNNAEASSQSAEIDALYQQAERNLTPVAIDDQAEKKQTSNRVAKSKKTEQLPARTQAFYDQYYQQSATEVVLKKPEDETSNILKNNSNFCQGQWITPIAEQQTEVAPENDTTTLEADYAYYAPDGTSFLEGDVQINQTGRQFNANRIEIDATQTMAKATGNIQLNNAGFVSQSEQLDYNLKTQTGDMIDSLYASSDIQAHGHAAKISRNNPDVTVLDNASFSTCAPEAKMPWKIEAKKIELNQKTGRGITRNAKLYVKDIPVFAIPYFNFPIDDRRTSGFLLPNFGYTSDGGVQTSIPYYLNLAPNYDLTLKPTVFSERGALVEGDFRYITSNYGFGRLTGGYLPSDRKMDKEDRSSLHFNHLWRINPQWQTDLSYNYVSDPDYFADLENDFNTQDELHQERSWSLRYSNGIPGLSALLRVQDFQTIDPATKDVDKPYTRLPQFLVNYIGGNPNGLEYEANSDIAYFKKSITDDSALENSGTRIYNRLATRYNYRTPWSYVIPEVSVRSLNNFYDQDSINSLGLSKSDSEVQNTVVPQVSLDTGLHFEKMGDKYLQTISPRLFYAYAPYEEQGDLPNFDSINASINYDQLFNPYRFYGHDRLDDNHFASLGVTYRAFNSEGLEKIKLGVGQSFYFDDRRVQLSSDEEIETSSNSGPIISISSQLSQNFTIDGNAAMSPDGDFSQGNANLFYTGQRGTLYNVGYYYRRDLPSQNQKEYDQLSLSFVQPINNRWRVFGHSQFDFNKNKTRELLAGINYESCCWGISVYGRSYYNQFDEIGAPDVEVKKAVMAELTFKGLGGFASKLNSILENKVLGLRQVDTYWKNY